ncbi:Na+/H+ antiporter NhaA [Thorsellia anophelis]|uniref:Na(+)/H(+) antiporter NhaA n=1 Tax=Thorsellia anophelis DSM 18579 TaxID=1123402 RepID=A0A1H9YDM7_9GAMM|nr:Na+/H+ antiporter NhaA [Thorsellia anophelis]SES66576.1 Na+:H+ antiporter, NhaA family [Thorsellia anophelis DSM 18579]
MKQYLQRFLAFEASGGIILILAAIAALIIANSPMGIIYDTILNTYFVIGLDPIIIKESIIHWINDGLMAIFFLIIGLEVKRELLIGALASRERALFPFIAAIGGIIAPAIIFILFNAFNPETRNGWAIPTATDIAFAVGVLSLLGTRIPITLKVFLLALAIIDDLGAILIIAFFYTKDIAWEALTIAAVATAILTCLNLLGVRRLTPYMVIGLILWVAVLKSGVHATIAGVIIGFCIPLRQNKRDHLHVSESPSEKLEHTLHPWVTWLILPLFAFANSGIVLSGITLDKIFSALPLGIALGLILGKPLGIYFFSWFAVKKGIATLPDNVTFRHILGVSFICGIGFTMSIFISILAFGLENKELINYAKVGILAGSIISGLLGYLFLRLIPAPKPIK